MVLADGTKVTVEGTADEVAILVQRISSSTARSPDDEPKGGHRGRQKVATKGGSVRSRTKGPAEHIRKLVADDFFKTKRGLAEVQKKLEEGAHIYPTTHLSPVLFRLVRAKELRRIKEGGTWKYVNP